MKNRIKQHMPGCCDFEPKSAEFDTLEELLAIDWIDRRVRDGFHRFSLSGSTLMAEYDEGKVWWVVGYIDRASGLELPRWKAVAAVEVV